MRRYTLSSVIAFGLVAVGILSFVRGQIVIGIAFVAIAILRLGTVMWGRKPRKPQPEIRLNLDEPSSFNGPEDSGNINDAHSR